jgi:amino acid adenylation domain-containing protein
LYGKLAGNPSFTVFLNQVRQTVIDAYEHQYIPFEKVIESLNVDRELSYHPVFQVMFTLQSRKHWKLNLAGLKTKLFDFEYQTAKFDLTLFAEEGEDKTFNFVFEYAEDLFKKDKIRRMAQHYVELLRAIVKNPQANIHSLKMLSDEEIYQIQHIWNSTAEKIASNKCLHERFEAVAKKYPLKVAVVHNDESITYHTLNQKANQLAYCLQRMGVRQNVVVGVGLDRSINLIIALLGILKAGGAYLPLDPTYPRARLSLMLSEARATIIVTGVQEKEKFDFFEKKLLLLDDLVKASDMEPKKLEKAASPRDLAYVIYTTGTTGVPKGVLITHANVLNLIGCHNSFEILPVDVMAQTVPYTFDGSVFEIWGTLCVGATLAIIDKFKLLDIEALKAYLDYAKINKILLTTSLFNQIVLQDRTVFDNIDTIFVGGSKVEGSITREIIKNVNVINIYGPTEATVISISHKIRLKDCLPGKGVPIGRPVKNAQIAILDNYFQAVPVGVIGEIYIAGRGVAKDLISKNNSFVDLVCGCQMGILFLWVAQIAL